MGGGRSLLAVSLVLLVLAAAPATATADATGVAFAGVLHGGGLVRRDACVGSIGECDEDETEWLMESGTGRRLLKSGNYLSYKAARSKQPAYSAKSGRSYRRGCSRIHRCRGGRY